VKKGRQHIVWVAGVLIALFATWVWVGLQHMDDASPPSTSTVLLEAVPVLAVALLSQLGLLLAPIVEGRSWKYRVCVAVLMAPTFIFTLSMASGHLREVAAYGATWFLRIDSVWIPVLILYSWQFIRLARIGPKPEYSEQTA
jgi:hypothetical protein